MAITYRPYTRTVDGEKELHEIKDLVSKDLSEPYSLYVFIYFIYKNPDLCIMAYDGDQMVGAIVCDLSSHRECRSRGYIAMLAVVESYRGRGIAKQLVSKAVQTMKDQHADEIVLEVEAVNDAAIHLYETVGFMRSKRLYHHYLNSNDAFRLILPLSERSTYLSKFLPMLDEGALPAAAA